MIQKTPVVVTYERVRMQHDNCDGYFETTGDAYYTNKRYYGHKCNKCGLLDTFNELYPRLDMIVSDEL